ncbi:MAG: diacylglycerol kinase family protein [Firmicutes bacterium]|nr:diacylglycerol kinase family protein [Bacillota bacterium]
MAKISRDDIKKRGLIRFFKSFKYSIEGLKYAYKYEQSMLIHVIATICVLLANIFFQVSGIEWLITLLAIGMVLSAELINSAIEAVVDLVTLEEHPLAKIAKDCSSAATFVLACMAALIGIVVYVPYIMGVLGL